MNANYGFFLLIFLVAFVMAIIATPIVSKLAIKTRIVDQPGQHKTHLKPKPLLGGLAIFMGFAATLLIFLDVDEKLLSLVTATVVLLATGLLDDIFNLKPVVKLLGQTAAASVVVIWNAHLFRFILDYFASLYLPGYIVIGLIIGWLVLMINAFNIIDGLDGLAAGTAAIIFVGLSVISILEGANPNVLGVQLIGAGACLGFLIFNFNPARIFMGDAGSMLLGFILATTHLFTIKYPFSAQLVLGSMFVFAYPALDITFAIYRRLCNRRSIFKADKGHIHHILLSLGFSVRKTVFILYIANLIFICMAVALLSLNLTSPVLLIIGILTTIAVLILFKRLIAISKQNGIIAYSSKG